MSRPVSPPKRSGEPARLAVSAETARVLALGHPWVIADGHTRRWPEGRAGDLALLVDAEGRGLATALRDPDDRIVARIIGRGACRPDAAFFAERLRAALALRQQHGLLGQTDAYRLVNGEGDGLPGLVIDRYGDYLLVQTYGGLWDPHLETLVAAATEVLAPAGLYLKPRPRDTRSLAGKRQQGAPLCRLLAGAKAPPRLVVEENGLRFLVTLEDGLHTGLFPDQRVNRRDLMQRVAGRRVLNLFSYTGAFSVAAAAAGATQVVSVDASAPYMNWAKDNFGVNRLDFARHEFRVGDAAAVLEEMGRERRRFDVVVMDPPAFSTTRESRFSTRGGTARLAAQALAVLEPGGLLLASCNHQKVSEAEYLKELRRGAVEAGCELRVLRIAGQPEDFPFPIGFPEGNYLKFVTGLKG